MSQFCLFAHGEEFGVDAFLATTTLRPDLVWRLGDECRSACFESGHETSGIQIVLGAGQSLPLWDQEAIAIAYLKEHRDELRALGELSGVRVFNMDLQYNFKLSPNTVGFWVEPAAPLMRHALDVGVRLSYYVRLDRRSAWGIEDA